MQQKQRYVGINNELNGGMTDTGKIIRDAWVFELIPEDETCEGWLPQGIESLWEKVNAGWEKYGFLVSGMPEEMRDRYMRIQATAIERAKEAGWSGDSELMGDT